MYNDNYNIVTTDNKNKKRKIMCVICFPKVELTLIDENEFRYKCPRCKNDYQILGYDGDLVPEEDELISSHEYQDEGPILLTADNTDPTLSILDREKGSKSDIKRPKYMQDSETTKVIEYRE